MKFYPEKISAYICKPRSAGRVNSPDAVGTNATLVCGCALRFTLRISDKTIAEVKFQTNGCGFLIAAAQILTDIVENKTLTELHGLEGFEKLIESELGEFPESRRHCLNLTIDTLQTAFNDFRSARLEEFSGGDPLICTCFGVSEETIQKIIDEIGCDTVDGVSRVCQAGSGCGSCQPLIQELIDSYDIIRS